MTFDFVQDTNSGVHSESSVLVCPNHRPRDCHSCCSKSPDFLLCSSHNFYSHWRSPPTTNIKTGHSRLLEQTTYTAIFLGGWSRVEGQLESIMPLETFVASEGAWLKTIWSPHKCTDVHVSLYQLSNDPYTYASKMDSSSGLLQNVYSRDHLYMTDGLTQRAHFIFTIPRWPTNPKAVH